MDLFVNAYPIWWCPASVALHVRLQLGRQGPELVHMITDDTPVLLPWRESRAPVHTFRVGTVEPDRVAAARDCIDPNFAYYNAVSRNCTAYVFCMLSELLGEDAQVLGMVAHTNRAFVHYFGTDFIDVNLRLGCPHALRWAKDTSRACHEAMLHAPRSLGTILDAQHSKRSCSLRRDIELRRASAGMLQGDEEMSTHYRFLWIGIVRAIATTEILCQLSLMRCGEF